MQFKTSRYICMAGSQSMTNKLLKYNNNSTVTNEILIHYINFNKNKTVYWLRNNACYVSANKTRMNNTSAHCLF